MTTVIDVGCARYGGDYSIERLIEMFHPDVLYGFDPMEPMGHAHTVDGVSVFVNLTTVGSAAWIFDGEVGFHPDGLNSCLTERTDLALVPCFDLARFITEADDKRMILKLDAEGSEYRLLDHLIEHRIDALLELLLVEWHCLDCGRGGADRIGHRPGCTGLPNLLRAKIEPQLACEYQEWPW